jgi:hypothetical protein
LLHIGRLRRRLGWKKIVQQRRVGVADVGHQLCKLITRLRVQRPASDSHEKGELQCYGQHYERPALVGAGVTERTRPAARISRARRCLSPRVDTSASAGAALANTARPH